MATRHLLLLRLLVVVVLVVVVVAAASSVGEYFDCYLKWRRRTEPGTLSWDGTVLGRDDVLGGAGLVVVVVVC